MLFFAFHPFGFGCLHSRSVSVLFVSRDTLFLTVLLKVYFGFETASRSKTLTRNVSVRNDLKMPRDHIIQSGSCTSFEYQIQLPFGQIRVCVCVWVFSFFLVAFQFSEEHLSNHISLGLWLGLGCQSIISPNQQ